LFDRVKISAFGPKQRCCRYQGPEKPPICENNHNKPNLVGMMVFVVPWGCAKHIGKNSNEIDIYRISQYIGIFLTKGLTTTCGTSR